MRRTAGGALFACAIVIAAFLAWRGPDAPVLAAGDTVASDLAALADETFAEFLAASPAVTACIGRPQLEAATELDEILLQRRDPENVADSEIAELPVGIHGADENISEGDLVWVRDQTHKRPLAIGWAKMDGTTLVEQLKGKGLKNIHWVGDELWEMEL